MKYVLIGSSIIFGGVTTACYLNKDSIGVLFFGTMLIVCANLFININHIKDIFDKSKEK